MASRQAILQFYVLLFIAAAASSFTIISADETSKSEEHTDKATVPDDSSSQEDSKEKRSQEEIMFGNQQNKPNGLVDDLMGMADNMGEDENSSMNLPDKKSTESQASDQSSEETSKEEKRASGDESEQNDMMMGSGAENWYNVIPALPNAMQYRNNAPGYKTLPSDDFTNSLYDQEDLYRRKRQLHKSPEAPRALPFQGSMYRRKRQLLNSQPVVDHHPLPLHKRSLRSSLGQMIQKRGIRLPRRSMRLKRQVDMEDLLNLFGNERYYGDEQQMVPHSFSGRARTVAKRHVPRRFNAYPESQAPDFRYPYVFQHRDDGVLAPDAELEENPDPLAGENMADIDDLLMMPPNTRYSEPPENVGIFPLSTREEENDGIQKWLSRHTTPSVFRVARRSSNFFYPIDYRYIPGYKKRSSFGNGNRGGSHFTGEEDAESDFGKWGHVVQVPEAYASPEDIARLYGLASLMAEEDDSKIQRRSA